MSLTLDEANRIIRGALAKAQELNIKISAAVCESFGSSIISYLYSILLDSDACSLLHR